MLGKKTFKEPADSNMGVVITPMLDMTFQLLFFFVMTFRTSNLLEGKLDFSLAHEPAQAAPVPFDNPPASQFEPPATVSLLVKVNNGRITDLEVQVADRPAVAVQPGITDRDLPGWTTDAKHNRAFLDALSVYLKGRKADPTWKDARAVKIAAETKVKYGRVVEIMDVCLDSGFRSVTFAVPPDLVAQ